VTSTVPRSALGTIERSGAPVRPGMRPPTAGRLISQSTWLAGAAASAGAGLIHLVLGPVHVAELGALGLGFYVSAGLQLGWAALAVAVVLGLGGRDPARPLASLAITGVAINVAILAAWAVSRTAGLPAGEAPWTPEAVGVSDAVASLFEAALVVGLVASLRGWRRSLPSRPGPMSAAGAVIAIALISIGTVVALLPSEAGQTHGEGQAHDDAAVPVESEVHAAQ